MANPKTAEQVQREKDDILAAARSVQRQLDRLADLALEMEDAGSYDDRLHVSAAIGRARDSVEAVERIASEWGARG